MGDYNYYLAREIIQNSLDAKVPQSKKPVVVKFTLENLNHDEFPGHEELISVFTALDAYLK